MYNHYLTFILSLLIITSFALAAAFGGDTGKMLGSISLVIVVVCTLFVCLPIYIFSEVTIEIADNNSDFVVSIIEEPLPMYQKIELSPVYSET